MSNCLHICLQLTTEKGTWETAPSSFRFYTSLMRKSPSMKTINAHVLWSKSQKSFTVMHNGVLSSRTTCQYPKYTKRLWLPSLIACNHPSPATSSPTTQLWLPAFNVSLTWCRCVTLDQTSVNQKYEKKSCEKPRLWPPPRHSQHVGSRAVFKLRCLHLVWSELCCKNAVPGHGPCLADLT